MTDQERIVALEARIAALEGRLAALESRKSMPGPELYGPPPTGRQFYGPTGPPYMIGDGGIPLPGGQS